MVVDGKETVLEGGVDRGLVGLQERERLQGSGIDRGLLLKRIYIS